MQLLSPVSLQRSATAAAVAGLIALPVAMWWIAGDQSYRTGPEEGPVALDYAFRPLPLSAGVQRTAGVGAMALVVGSLVVLIAHARAHRWDARWRGPLVAMGVAGVIVGSGWRVMSAGVIGANIGVGLVVLFGGPVVLGLLAWAGARTVVIVRRPPLSTQ